MRTLTGDDGVVIVGGGLASQRCAETLRSRGYGGRVRIVCGEPEAPYDRPPLSKGALAGDTPDRDLAFRPQSWYKRNEVELITGRLARKLRAKRNLIELDDGAELAYERLLIATGSSARSLPALEGFSNVHALRTIADARRLRSELRQGARLAVIGAGFIGQEVAATARAAGVEVTIVEALPAPLTHILGQVAGAWFADLHTAEGVDVRVNSMLESARGNGAVEELRIKGGDRVACDAVVVGVGVAPAAGWLRGSGLETDGVITDHAGRTRLPGVFAAGDVARSFDHRAGEHTRTEHWDAAARQGMAAAQAMLGGEPDQAQLPSFWSDQYGMRIQYVGHAHLADASQVNGDPAQRDFELVYTRAGLPVAALAVGRPRAFARLRKQIERAHEEHNDLDQDPDEKE